MHWSKPLRLHLGVLVVGSLLCTSTPIIWLAFSHGKQAAVSAGAQQMREMSLRLIEGYRNTLQGGTETVALASTLPQLASPPLQDLQAKQDFFLEVLRNIPNATSIYTGYPDGSYLQVISTTRRDVRQTLAAPDGAAFAIRTIAGGRPAASPRRSAFSTIRPPRWVNGPSTTPPSIRASGPGTAPPPAAMQRSRSAPMSRERWVSRR